MDTVARVLGQSLTDKLKQAVIVENRPGAGGSIGTQYVRQQTEDENVALLTTASFVAAPLLNPGAKYDPVSDFQPICGIFDSFAFVIANGSVPANSLSEFIEFAKSSEHPIEAGTPGPSGGSHVVSLYLAKRAGFEILPIPYKGNADMELGVVSGDVKMIITTLSPSILSHVKEGRLKILGVSSRERLPSLPDIATVSESVPDFYVDGWGGLYAPLNVDSRRLTQVARAVESAIKDQQFRELMESLMFTQKFYTGVEFRQATKRLYEAYKLMLRETG